MRFKDLTQFYPTFLQAIYEKEKPETFGNYMEFHKTNMKLLARKQAIENLYIRAKPSPDQPAPDKPAPDQPAPDKPAPDQPAPDQPVKDFL